MTEQPAKPLISLVIPVHNEAAALPTLLARLEQVLEPAPFSHELLFVDDGSSDATPELLREQARRNPQVAVLCLTRQFGKEAALLAGLEHCRGDAAIPLDADLQDPPELIPELVARWQEGYEVVCAVRRKRNDPWLKRVSAESFYSLISSISNTPISDRVGDFRLLDRQVIEALRLLPERALFMKGMMAWVGFRSCEVPYDRPARQEGQSKWPWQRLVGLALDGITSFSNVPLYLWMYCGALVSLLSVGYGIFLIIRTLITGVVLPGYISIMTAVLFMGGLQLLSIGVLGQYIGRIFMEVKRRPRYLIRSSTNITIQGGDAR